MTKRRVSVSQAESSDPTPVHGPGSSPMRHLRVPDRSSPLPSSPSASDIGTCAGCPRPGGQTRRFGSEASSAWRSLTVFLATAVVAGCGPIGVDPLTGILSRTSVSTYAGDSFGHKDGPLRDARFTGPAGLAFDRTGNLWIASEVGDHAIRKIGTDGQVLTIAGDLEGFADGPGPEARFRYPRGLAFDADGNLFVADTGNNRIRKVAPDGHTVTIAGSFSGFRDGKGAEAMFSRPSHLVVDGQGRVWISDSGNNRIRLLAPDGVVTTYAGGASGNADGPRTEATFNQPQGLAFDHEGNLYVADSGNAAIRRISTDGSVSTLARLNLRISFGFPFMPGPQGVAVGMIEDLAVARDGTLYVSTSSRIYRLRGGGQPEVVAGYASNFAFDPEAMSGDRDGPGLEARFRGATGIAESPDGALYIADRANHRIRKLEIK